MFVISRNLNGCIALGMSLSVTPGFRYAGYYFDAFVWQWSTERTVKEAPK